MIILVTGGAQRIGAGLVNHFCHQGHTVVLHYNLSEQKAFELQNKWGSKVFLFQGDLSISATITELMEVIRKQFGTLDCIVNNASIFRRATIEETTDDLLAQTMAINAVAPTQIIRGALSMLQQGLGSVVNMIDNASHTRPWPYHVAYGMGKSALVAATRSMAVELAPDIRVNAVGPGLIQLDNTLKEESLVSKIPMSRMGTVQEIVETVDFLLFGPRYITGQVLLVDGGWSIAP